MNLLIVNQYALPPDAAGITRHADLGRELVRRGHQVTVISSRFDYLTRRVRSSPSIEELGGVQFLWLNTGRYRANDASRVRSMLRFALSATLAGARARPRPSVVMGSSPQLLAGLSAWLIAKRFRVPFVLEIRDPWPSALVDLGAIRKGSIAHRVLEEIEAFLYRRAACIVTAMEHVDRRVAEVGADPRKCVVVPNAATVPPKTGAIPISLANLISEARKDGRTVFLYAGAHGISNGLGELLDALSHLKTQNVDTYKQAEIFLVGDGPEKASLAARAASERHDNVHFFDPIPKPSALAAMQASDFVLIHFANAAFKTYGMSANKLFDAMSVARPVVMASPLEDTPVDLVRCGIRYQPGDLRQLANALLSAIELPVPDRVAMGERGLGEARATYNLSSTAAKLDAALTAIADG